MIAYRHHPALSRIRIYITVSNQTCHHINELTVRREVLERNRVRRYNRVVAGLEKKVYDEMHLAWDVEGNYKLRRDGETVFEDD